MIGSFRLGSVFGISLRVHWLSLVLVMMLMLGSAGYGLNPLAMLVVVSVLFAVVVLHELGHSLVAKRFGIRVLDITIWPLGGMARMSEIPENSRIEALIAIAGPAVNFVLALLVLPVLLLAMTLQSGGVTNAVLLVNATYWFLAINLLLGVFNLLPAFPMDGGRVLRAYLGRKGDWLTATERAVRVGRLCAGLMVLAAIWNPLTGGPNLILALIGAFVWFAGTQELLAVRMRHARSGLGPLEPLFRQFFGDRPEDPRGARPVGPTPPPPPSPPPSADAEGARRPRSWNGAGLESEGPWTEERLRELESFRGRLPRSRPAE